jgi:hypothetical protein
MNNRICIIALVFLFAFSTVISAQTVVEAKASVDKNSVTLGDTLRYSIDVKVNGNLGQSPRLTPPSFEGFRIVGNRSSHSTSIINGKATVVTSIIYDLLAIKSGEVTIPPASVVFQNSTTKVFETIKTKSVILNVGKGKSKRNKSSVQATPTTIPFNPQYSNIKEIKVKLDLRAKDILPYVFLFFAFVAGIVVFAYFVFRKKDAEAVEELVDYRKTSFKMLKKAQTKLKKGDTAGFYSGAYEALRYFLSSHYNESFDELTTREIIKNLRKMKVEKKEVDRFKTFMAQCDLVKFADYKTSDKEIEDDLALVADIIETQV